MRINPHYARTIKAITRDIYGLDAVVRLFGSRAFDDRRGGDIDLHVEVDPQFAAMKFASQFHLAMEDRLGEEQIDLVVFERGQEPRWIDKAAFREGIIL